MINSNNNSNNNNDNNTNSTNSINTSNLGTDNISAGFTDIPAQPPQSQQPPPPSPFNPSGYQVPNAPRSGPAPTPQYALPTPRNLDDATTSDNGAPPPIFSFGKRSGHSLSTGSLSSSSVMPQQQQQQPFFGILKPQTGTTIPGAVTTNQPPPSPFTPGMYNNMPPTPVPGPAPTPIGAAPTPRNLDESATHSDDGMQSVPIWNTKSQPQLQQQQQQQLSQIQVQPQPPNTIGNTNLLSQQLLNGSLAPNNNIVGNIPNNITNTVINNIPNSISNSVLNNISNSIPNNVQNNTILPMPITTIGNGSGDVNNDININSTIRTTATAATTMNQSHNHHQHHHNHNKHAHNKNTHHKKETDKKNLAPTGIPSAIIIKSIPDEEEITKENAKQTHHGSKRKRERNHRHKKHKHSKRAKHHDDDDDDDNSSSSSGSDSDSDNDESSSSESESDNGSALDRKRMKLMLLKMLQGGIDKSMFGSLFGSVAKQVPSQLSKPQIASAKSAVRRTSKSAPSSMAEVGDKPYIYLKFYGDDGPNFLMKGNTATLGRDKSCQFRIAERTLKTKVFTIVRKPNEGFYIVPARDQAISIDDAMVTSSINRVHWGQKISFTTENLFSFILIASTKLFTEDELRPSYEKFYEENKSYILEKEPTYPAQVMEKKKKKAGLSKGTENFPLLDSRPLPNLNNLSILESSEQFSKSSCAPRHMEHRLSSVAQSLLNDPLGKQKAPLTTKLTADEGTPNNTNINNGTLNINNGNNNNSITIKYALDYYFEDMKDSIRARTLTAANNSSVVEESNTNEKAKQQQQQQQQQQQSKTDSDVEASFKIIKGQLAEIFARNVIPPEAITESLDNFSYYLNKTVQRLLTNSAYLYLVRPDIAHIAAGLKTLTRTVLLCAPEGTELYQEALGKALAKYFGACVLTIGRDDFTHNVVKFADGKVALKHRPYGNTAAALIENAAAVAINADGSTIYDADNFYDEESVAPANPCAVGSRVVYNRSGTLGMHPDKNRTKDGPEDGAHGTVVLQFPMAKRVGVQFDVEFPLGSSLGGYSRPGCGAFVDSRHLEREESKACTEQVVLDAVGDVLAANPQRPTVVLVKEPIALFERSATLPNRLRRLIERVESEGLPVVFFALNSNREWEKYKSAAAAAASAALSAQPSVPLVQGGTLGTTTTAAAAAAAAVGAIAAQGALGGGQQMKPPNSFYGDPGKAVYLGNRIPTVDNMGTAHKVKRVDFTKNTLEERFRCLVQLFPTCIEVKAPTDSTELARWREHIENDTFKIKLCANKETLERVQDKLSVQVGGDIGTIPEMNSTIFSQEEMSQIVAYAISDHLQKSNPTETPTQTASEKVSSPLPPPPSTPPVGTEAAPNSKQRLSIPLECFATGLRILLDSKPDKVRMLVSKVNVSNDYERNILSDVITPEESGVRFKDVGALEEVKKTLHEIVMLPLQRPELFRRGNLAKPTKGILLFGPPGTGKTLLARAIATESGANFIAISPSSVTSKYVGDSNKLIRAVFSLATKIAPTIIFIDEVDSILGTRESANEHDVSRKIKNEFMACWDGLRTSQTERVIVLAATNRPMDLDDAVLRRLSRRILVDLPDTPNREKILRIILKDEDLEDDFDFGELAKKTAGYSGSDLRNLCIVAAQRPLREFLEKEKEEQEKEKKERESGEGEEQNKDFEMELDPPSPTKALYTDKSDVKPLRKLNLSDFEESIKKVGKSVSDNAASLTALRKWNQEFGDGNKATIPQYSYYN